VDSGLQPHGAHRTIRVGGENSDLLVGAGALFKPV
jgi:hypothetical protein